jgi:LmbE family N-acetylglucosaminyl deacetylase
MEFRKPGAAFVVPDGRETRPAIARTTHLGIGAHSDDLEFMALHGILASYGQPDRWFGGVTCTDGAGSVSPDAGLALVHRRQAEQNEAARIGQYGFMAQLNYTSAESKDRADSRLTDDLADLLASCHPDVVYTHNPADKHATHVAVMARVIGAIRRLPPAQRPGRVLGCEVWRDLDWLADADKVYLDVSGNPHLAEQLASVFVSQIDGGKRYDRAVRGREVANATFQSSHRADGPSAVWLAMDLTPLITDDHLTVSQLVNRHLARFKNDVMEQLARYE